jgi:signal transduction histidine kinase/DNA-binding response OmpR family regulator
MGDELVSFFEPQAPLPSTEILLVDDDPKTLLAMEAMLTDLGASLVTARNGRDALLKLLSRDFAVILLDVQMPEIDGFQTAELIRERDKSRHTPIIFLTAFSQNDRALLRGYGLGAVDFLFKPIVPEILRSKVQVFVELQRKTHEVQRQARLIGEAEALRAQMEKLAEAVAERDAVARALVQSNARLALLSDTANRLLTGHRPHALLGDLFDRLTGHLDLDLYAHRRLEDDGESLTLQSHGGIPPDDVGELAVSRVGDDGLAGTVAATRRRLIVDDRSASGDVPPSMRKLDMTACVCFPLIAEDRLIGTLAFGSRRRPRFNIDELAVLQMVADQIAIALERERLLNELKQRNSELADADRRKDEFLAMLAHELRNPLAPIVNALHVVGLETAARGDTVSRAHATMDRQVRHLIRLVDDLLDVSRITQGKIELRREQAELQSVIEHALQIARPVVKTREHTLVVEVPDEPLPVWVDVTRMTQVVANLVNNAAKYTNPGGTITVKVERSEEEAIVRVRDTGIGIRPEMLPRVFELFVQEDSANDRTAGGLGIGLTLVKRLVQMHGGEVLAQSDGIGKGSEFIVIVPIALGDEVPSGVEMAQLVSPPKSPNSPNSIVPRRLRILVVEDNADIRETLKELLEIEGHEVTVAVDGNAAVAVASNGHEHDVALVDIGLPGLDGYGVARKLRDIQKQRGYPRRLIAMTGYGQAEDRRRALEAGFDAHLVKPVDPEMLTRLLDAQPIEGDA